MHARGVIAGVAAASLLVGVPAGQAAQRPALRVVDTAPLTVAGAGFRALERVTVHVRAASSPLSTVRVRATRAGRFTVQLPRVSRERCAGALAVATGAAGSRAIAKIVFPLCPPPIKSPY